MGAWIVLAVFLAIGAVLGWVAFFRISSLKAQLQQLQQELGVLRKQVLKLAAQEKSPAPASIKAEPQSPTVNTPAPKLATTAAPAEPGPAQAARIMPLPPSATPASQAPPLWLQHLQDHWMVWLGGVCVALAGIFMVRYSIEQNLVSPTMRVINGVLLGLCLHVAALWLRSKRGNHISFAALAGGGSITLFAALLTALHLYQLLSPLWVFVALAVVALVSMWLALLHGPVLAILGILGAYLVPILVGGDGGNAGIVLIYALVISGSALLLLRHVEREWIWLGALAGGLLWWLLTLSADEVDGFRGLYLAAFAWLVLAFPTGDWWLRARFTNNAIDFTNLLNAGSVKLGRLPLALLGVIAALGFSMLSEPADYGLVNWLTLPLLVLFVAGKRDDLSMHPWCLLLIQLGAVLCSRLNGALSLTVIPPAELPAFYQYCIASVLVYSGMALYHFRSGTKQALWISLALMCPLGFLTLSYVLTEKLQISLQWSLLASLLGGIYLAWATAAVRQVKNHVMVSAWLFIAGHLAYSLAVTMFVREAGLTLALAVQIISIGWVIKRFQLDQLDLVFKLVVMALIARLSLNPWLHSYAVSMYWPVLTYAGATLCAATGMWLLRQRPQLQLWTGGATIHLLTLTVWVVLRFVLYDGVVFAVNYNFTEAVLNLNIFAAVGLVYYWRARFSENLAFLCRLYAKILLAFALFNYAVIVLATASSSSWVYQTIGTTALFNLLLLAYGTPALLAWLSWRFYLPASKALSLALCAGATFIFISLEIMHLWRGNIRLNGPMSDGELYTYSIVWLLMAIAAILGGVWRFGIGCYRAGLALLLLVLIKLFLIDMDGLTGLLRVASFMGMGLALLAIAYLHQRLTARSVAQGLPTKP